MQPNPYQSPTATASFGGGGGQYEFSEAENEAVRKIATRARLWGIISVVVGLVTTIPVLIGALLIPDMGQETTIIRIVLLSVSPVLLSYLIMGFLYIGAGNSLQQVVITRGDDIAHVLAGVSKLSKAFWIEVVITVITMVAGLVIGLIALGMQS